MFEDCVWLNEPQNWRLEDDALRVVTDSKTDFWRETHYGFTRDSGHFFGRPVNGDFTAQIKVQAKYEELYDQAGLMLRIDETRWVKAGIEISDGAAMLSSVLTDGKSDWAIAAYGQDASSFWIRATVAEGVLKLQVSADGKIWPLFRLAPFPRAAGYLVGPMCCTPERSGLEVAFSGFRVSAPLGKDLHDLS
jgi:regulation of enolase protein 1 (concanavalin A-like superfamily)